MPMDDEQLTPHFRLAEFGDVPRAKTAAILLVAQTLEIVRQAIGLPITITSGYRSPEHNAAVGGVPNSAHIRALAADYEVRGIDSLNLASATHDALRHAGTPWDQIIWYSRDDHVHIGLDHRMRRQFFRGDR